MTSPRRCFDVMCLLGVVHGVALDEITGISKNDFSTVDNVSNISRAIA